ncbi:hypothetical protein BH10ACI4_BH10ACI4_29360 [soil metagenome]
MVRLIVRRRLLLGAALWIAGAASMWGQNAAAVVNPPTYDVVSIKPNKSGSDLVRIMWPPDRFSATEVSLKQLLLYAYNLKLDSQILGLPGAISDARFDIEAKFDDESVATLKKLSKDEENGRRRVMMQAILADRFRLRAHPENKELPIYALVVAKGGSRLKEADPNNTYSNGIKGPDGISRPGMWLSSNGELKAQAVLLKDMEKLLGERVDRLVVDKTGLTGKYDFNLQWTPEENRGTDDGTGKNSGPSIFTALQEQLGLKLESTKERVKVVVVDSVAMPSEN